MSNLKVKPDQLSRILNEMTFAKQTLAVDVTKVQPQTRNSWLGAQNMALQAIERLRKEYLQIAREVTGYIILRGPIEEQRQWASQVSVRSGAIVVDVMRQLIEPMALKMRHDVVGHAINVDDLIAIHYMLDEHRYQADLGTAYFEPNLPGILQRSIRSLPELQMLVRDYGTKTMPREWWADWIEKNSIDNAIDKSSNRSTLRVVVVGLDDNLVSSFGSRKVLVASTKDYVRETVAALQNLLTPGENDDTIAPEVVAPVPVEPAPEEVKSIEEPTNKPRAGRPPKASKTDNKKE
jgi:hypothetical protein